ncbi:MAG TPA: AtpZ/AtpI family protein, partial [Acidobacteriaceae bacterium]|nr:AtpZ/AtpI family protein [Acidobacteriaceae bacterium]
QGQKRGGGVFGDLVKAESMIQLALAIPAGCLVGWGMGTLADHYFHTSWGMVVGILVGAVAGFVQIFTTASKLMKRGD